MGLRAAAAAAITALILGVACASGRRPVLWYPVPDATAPAAPSFADVRGSKAAARAIPEDEQTAIIARVVREFYGAFGDQARWIDPRPLAHLRSADDTVGSDPDWEDEIVARVHSTKVCGLEGSQDGCRGRPGGVLRFSYPYRVGRDSAVVYATYSPIRTAGAKPEPIESEMQFQMLWNDSSGRWELARKVTVPTGRDAANEESARSAAENVLVIRDVGVVDARSQVAVSQQTVLIRGNRIVSVGPRANPPAGARVIDGRGKYLIPGLWDMHVHTQIIGGRALLALYVANGVTGVRDMAGEFDTLTMWRRDINRGTLVGPRLVISGPYLEGGDVPIPHLTVRTAADAAPAVDSLIKLGVDFVKVHTQMRPETFFAIARATRERRIVLAGHVPNSVGAEAASDSGIKSLEHMLAIPAPCTPAESLALRPRFPVQAAIGRCRSTDLAPLYAKFVRNGTWVTPTFAAAVEIATWPKRPVPGDSLAGYLPDTLKKFVAGIFPMPDSIPPNADSVGQAMLAKRMKQLADMHRAGVQVLAGTDAPLRNSPPGFGLHEELLLLTRGGLTPFEALRAATLGPARFLGVSDSLGTVEPGRIADLVLLDANPLTDIRNTRRIAAVVRNGRYIDSAERVRLLRAGIER